MSDSEGTNSSSFEGSSEEEMSEECYDESSDEEESENEESSGEEEESSDEECEAITVEKIKSQTSDGKTELSFEGEFSEEGLTYLLELLKPSSETVITSLDLGGKFHEHKNVSSSTSFTGCKLGGKEIEQISEALKANTSLIKIDLSTKGETVEVATSHAFSLK